MLTNGRRAAQEPGRVVLRGRTYMVGADGEAKLVVVAAEPNGAVCIQVAHTTDLFNARLTTALARERRR